MIDATYNELADISAVEAKLAAKLASLRRHKDYLKVSLIENGQAQRLVNDHALLRYMERHKGIDVDGLRAELRGIADAAEPAKDGEHHWHHSGVILILGSEGQIITVLSPEQSQKWDGRKLKTGTRVSCINSAQIDEHQLKSAENETGAKE